MKVKVKVFAMFRELLGTSILTVEMKDGSTVNDLINWISDNINSKFKNEILDRNRNIKKYVKVLVNGRNIDFLEGLNTKLKDGDVISFFPPVAGG